MSKKQARIGPQQPKGIGGLFTEHEKIQYMVGNLTPAELKVYEDERWKALLDWIFEEMGVREEARNAVKVGHLDHYLTAVWNQHPCEGRALIQLNMATQP